MGYVLLSALLLGSLAGLGMFYVVSRCNLRNGLPAAYGWSMSQFFLAKRNFNDQDRRFFNLFLAAFIVSIALSIYFIAASQRA
jgi:hypothetical protein